jgi:hypothetical protein
MGMTVTIRGQRFLASVLIMDTTKKIITMSILDSSSNKEKVKEIEHLMCKTQCESSNGFLKYRFEYACAFGVFVENRFTILNATQKNLKQFKNCFD